MRQYSLIVLYVVGAVVFTTIAALTANRIIIAVLFLMLLGFIAVADRAIRRLRQREKELTERVEVLTRELEAGRADVPADKSGEPEDEWTSRTR